MNPDDLARILDELGQRLGPTGEYVFALAVRQVYINAVTSVVALSVIVLVGWFAIPRLNRWRTAPGADDTGGRDLILLLPAFMYGALVIGLALWTLGAVPSIFNPEYAALRDILSAINPKR